MMKTTRRFCKLFKKGKGVEGEGRSGRGDTYCILHLTSLSTGMGCHFRHVKVGFS